MKKVNMSSVASFAVAAGAVALGLASGCVGDSPSPTAVDAATEPVPTSTAKDGSTPVVDASSPDTAAPIPDANTPDAAVAFEPKQVGGLVLWLDPATGVTDVAGKVSAWADVSTSSIVVSQSTAANQPSKATIGGKPVLAFSATTWLDCAGATVDKKLDFGQGDVLVETAVSLDSGTVTPLGGYLYKTKPGAPYDGLQMYSNLGGGGKPGGGLDGETSILTATNGNVADGKLHLLALRRVGDKLSIRLDGLEVASKTVAARSIDNTSALEVGGRSSGVHSTGQKVGDLLVYKGAVSDADVAKIEGFLKAKSGI